MYKFYLSTYFFLTTIVFSTSTAVMAEVIDIKCGYMLDVIKHKKIKDVNILIKNGNIIAVGKNIKVPENSQNIDLSNSYCLPGLTDMHVHLFIPPDMKSNSDLYLKQSSAQNALIGLKNAQTLLHSGFTTVRMVGDFDYGFAGIALRDAFASGQFDGPRMFVAPHALSPVGGHMDINDIAPDTPFQITGTVIKAGEDSVRDAVRREIKYGADWIKIMGTGGVVSLGDDPEVQLFTDEEMHAFASETHRHGKKITAHIHGNSAAIAAANAGFDSIEHGTMLKKDGIQALVDNGTYLIPTLYVVNWLLENGPQLGLPEEILKKAELVSKTHAEAVYAAYQAGVNLAFGTDQIFPHNETSREFAAMVKVGITPWDTLSAATINSAELLGMEDSLGSIEVGKKADIVAVPQDPIDNITTMEHVEFVMLEGQIIRDDSKIP